VRVKLQREDYKSKKLIKAYLLAIAYTLTGIIITFLLFSLNEKYSIFLMKVLIAIGVLGVSFAAGISTVIAAKYD
jgi:4-amino-4-deoxy-L-arabinose transferase-like glycosyltransferase